MFTKALLRRGERVKQGTGRDRGGSCPPGKNGPGPRPCPASIGQSGPAALTDGPSARSRGRPAPALRWGQMAREDRSWTSASVDPGRLPASHSRHSSGNRTRESPGSRADALSAVRTHLCLDSVPGAQRFLGPRARPACLGPGVLPPLTGPSQPPTSQDTFLMPVPEHRTQIRPDSLNSVLPGKGHDPTAQLVFSLCSFTLQSCLRIGRQSRGRNHHAAREQKTMPSGKLYLGASIHTELKGRKKIILSVIFKNSHALLIKKNKSHSCV